MRVLVTGGAGYIGAHTVLQLLEAGAEVVIEDNFINSSREVLTRMRELAGRDIPFAEIDVADSAAVGEVLDVCGVDEVIHFAGRKAVGRAFWIRSATTTTTSAQRSLY